jgi:hypothetical protein
LLLRFRDKLSVITVLRFVTAASMILPTLILAARSGAPCGGHYSGRTMSSPGTHFAGHQRVGLT